MPRETISFRMDSEKREALDAVASALDRDRSNVINEAIEAYLDVHRCQLEHIREGLRQADGGEFATEAGMKAAFSRPPMNAGARR
jgi:RHH-type transcriptional regulator, rel operon repressor / antitoxin RelB